MSDSLLLLAGALVAFLLSWMVHPHFRSLGFLTGIVDHPGYRRPHAEPVPRTGGMAIFLSFFILDESITISLIVGTVFVLAGVYLTNHVQKTIKEKR